MRALLLLTICAACRATAPAASLRLQERPEPPVSEAPEERPRETGGPPQGFVPPKTFEPFLNAAVAHQLEADLGEAGSFDVDRLFVEPGFRYSLGPKLRMSVSAGWSRDDYRFSGPPSDLGSDEPWGTMEMLRVNVGFRWLASEKWAVFGGPTLRSAVERGVSYSDGLFGGALGGAAYRVNDQLSIGPGLGFFTQIEDRPSVFPILLIRWQVAESVKLETGRGLGASQGPGLILTWTPAESWELLFGGRFERQRFRLDSDGVAPDGVGEESSAPIFLALTRKFGRASRVGLVGGVNLAGQLRLDDERGDEIAVEDYDPVPFLGFVVEL